MVASPFLFHRPDGFDDAMTLINQDTALSQSLVMNLNDTSDHLYGLESKKYRVYAASASANPIVQVQPRIELPFELRETKSAIVENLIIDGQNLGGISGIKLQNVYNCLVRNVTIKNCDVGVEIGNLYGAWSEFTRLEHIRMDNVNKGILFTSNGPLESDPNTYPGDSAGFTTIDDVGITLANNAAADKDLLVLEEP